MSPAIVQAFSLGTDPMVNAYAANVKASSGSLSTTALNAICRWFYDVRSGGSNSPWAYVLQSRVNFLASDFAGLVVPAVTGGAGALDTVSTFSSSDFTSAGLQCASGKQIQTSFIPRTLLAVNNTHIMVFNLDAASVGNNGVHGCRDSNGEFKLWAPYGGDSVLYFDAYNQSADEVASPSTITYKPGLLMGQRGSGGVIELFQGSTLLKQQTAVGTDTLPAVEAYIGAANGYVGATLDLIGGYSLGPWFPHPAQLIYATAWQTLNHTLSRI